jgi:hypothetical protein
MPRVRGAVTATAHWFWSPENPWSHRILTRGEEHGAPPSLAATVARVSSMPLVNTSSCLVDRSAGNGLLRQATAAGRAHCCGHAAPAGWVTVGHPSRCQRLRLEGPNTPSAHLILPTDRQMNDSHLMKSRELVHRRRGLGPPRRGPIPPVF